MNEKYWHTVEKMEFLGHKDVLNIACLSHDNAYKIVSTFPWKAAEMRQFLLLGLSEDDLLQVKGIRKATALRIAASVKETRNNVPYVRFLRACGVGMISLEICKKIAELYPTVEHLYDNLCFERPSAGTKEDIIKRLENISGVGHKTAEYIASKEFWDDADMLLEWVTIAEDTPTISTKESKP